MISFKPVFYNNDDKFVVFKAFENEALLGECELLICETRAEIKSLFCNEDKPYIAEGLIKSAFNYAALKNCYMGYITAAIPSVLLDTINLQKDEGLYFNDIPSILQGICCKNKL